MKYRIFAVCCYSMLILNLGGSTLAGAQGRRSGAELVSLLPASEGVMIVDVKRSFEALPKLLANNPAMLSKITSHIESFQAKTGIDIRQFDSIAAGINAKPIANKKYDIDPVVIARGQTSAAS
jgi:hypothetical protein